MDTRSAPAYAGDMNKWQWLANPFTIGSTPNMPDPTAESVHKARAIYSMVRDKAMTPEARKKESSPVPTRFVECPPMLSLAEVELLKKTDHAAVTLH
eukprot:scaffold19417_cov62-Isochrysis_galbana.AAC.1